MREMHLHLTKWIAVLVNTEHGYHRIWSVQPPHATKAFCQKKGPKRHQILSMILIASSITILVNNLVAQHFLKGFDADVC
jgi:hypothetical protein